MSDYGMRVEDAPALHDASSGHRIVHEDGLNIPLGMDGVVSYFESRKPTQGELEDFEKHIEMTSPMECDPSSTRFSKNEELAQASAVGLNEMLTDDATAGTVKRQYAPVYVDEALRRVEELAVPHSLPVLRIAEGYDGWLGDVERKTISAMSSKSRQSTLSPTDLSKKWGISIPKAAQTMRVTTQAGVRNLVEEPVRRFRTQEPWLLRRRLMGRWYTDTMFPTTVSIRGNKCAQVITNGKGYARFYPMTSKAHNVYGLRNFVDCDGIPDRLISDGAWETTTKREWKATCNQLKINLGRTEPYSPWQNRAESEIREIKRDIRRYTHKRKSPKRLWCLLGEYVTKIRRVTASTVPSMQGITPEEHVLKFTPDISRWVEFQWYEWVWFFNPKGEKQLARWVGIAEDAANYAHRCLTANTTILGRSTVWSVSGVDMRDPAIIERMRVFDSQIKEKIGDDKADREIRDQLGVEFGTLDENDIFDETADGWDPVEPDLVQEEADDVTPEAADEYLTAKVLIS